MKRPRRALAGCGLALAATLLLASCDTLSYYTQAISGQYHLFSHRQPIAGLLSAPDTDPQLRVQLEQVQAIRRFAAEELGLRVGEQYSSYVELQRSYVVWNVFAAPEFSLQPRSWCYPIAGCVSYRGYFDEDDARAFAARLAEEGFDVYVGGVSAYSTLGWFRDPVLSTVVNRRQHQLATLLFHELAHGMVYVPGDTEFNESFATAVEQEGLRRWLRANVADAERAELERAVLEDSTRQQQFVELVQGAVADLRLLYELDLPEPDKRQGKAQRLTQLRADYETIRAQQWNGYGGYDDWFRGELNNAQLGTVATYNNLVPAFTALLAEADGDLPAFYARAAELGKLERAERTRYLQGLVD